jgi:type I restriction enzyme S subunit
MFVSPADLGRSKYVMTTAKLLSKRGFARCRRVPAGSTLFVCIGSTIGKVGIAGRDLATNQQINAVIPNRNIDPEYLYYAATTLSATVRRQAGEQAVPLVNKTQFGVFEILLPSRREQRQVAQALSSADDLVEALERLITKKEAIKQGTMQELLTGRTRLPGFSDPWRLMKLGDHVTYVRTVPLSRDQLDVNSSLRYLHYGDIHTRTSVFLDAARESMPRATARLAGRAGRLGVGDLVFADASEDTAGVGKSVEISGVPPSGVIAGLHTVAARFDRSVLADGFKAYIQFIPSFRHSLLRLVAGTKVLATTRSYLSSIDIELPSVDEQRAISAALIACDYEISVLGQRLEKARCVKQGMAQELLTGRTRLPLTEAVK